MMNRNSNLIFRLLLIPILLFLTNPIQAQEEGEPQRLPDGVTKPIYKHIYPTGGKVEKPQICPPSWWIGMKNTELEIMIHDTNIAGLFPNIKHEGVSIKGVSRLANPNYLFITINISENAKIGKFSIELSEGKKIAKRYSSLLSGTKIAKRRTSQKYFLIRFYNKPYYGKYICENSCSPQILFRIAR